MITLIDSSRHYPFSQTFIEKHGQGPYDLQLMEDYHDIYQETRECYLYLNQDMNEEDCLNGLSERSKELRDLYSEMNDREFLRFVYVLLSTTDFYQKRVQEYQEYIEEQKLIKDKTPIESYFFNKMADYHANNPIILLIEDGQVYYTYEFQPYRVNTYYIIGAAVAILMVLISISKIYSNVETVDYIILTTKTGRKILLYKFISVIIFTVFLSLICIIPLILMHCYLYNWDVILGSKLSEPMLLYLFWYDFNLFQYLVFTLILTVIATVFVAITATIIATYSRKLINILVYNLLLIAIVISVIHFFDLKGSDTFITQLTRIIFLHTPYGVIYKNVHVFEYSYFYGSSYLTYREFPFVFIGLNLLMVMIGIEFCYRYYKKLNI